jgi:hypothetical protein
LRPERIRLWFFAAALSQSHLIANEPTLESDEYTANREWALGEITTKVCTYQGRVKNADEAGNWRDNVHIDTRHCEHTQLTFDALIISWSHYPG